MDNTEQVDYDTLYDAGFNEGNTDVETKEPIVEENIEVEETQETEEVEEAIEQLDEVEEETLDEEPESTEPDSIEEELIALDYKGQEIKVTKAEQKKLAQMGFDYTSKTQDLASKRNLLELIGDRTPEEVKTMIDAFGGDKEALSYMAKQANIDPYDLDIESQYKPKVEAKNYELDDIVNTIKSDTELSSTMDRWIDTLPKSTLTDFQKDPKLLGDLYQEARVGNAQKVMPEAIKRMALDSSISFKEAYLSARETVVSKPEVKKPADRDTIKKAVVPKKSASKHMKEHKDVWEDDELFEQMKKMTQRY